MASELPHSPMMPDDISATQSDTSKIGPTPQPQKPIHTSDHAASTSHEAAEDDATVDDDMGEELSPMRTHEQSGYMSSIADKFSNLVEESDDEEQALDVDKVDHDAMKRKELTRQKTSDGGKQNKLRDRLKRTVSKSAD